MEICLIRGSAGLIRGLAYGGGCAHRDGRQVPSIETIGDDPWRQASETSIEAVDEDLRRQPLETRHSKTRGGRRTTLIPRIEDGRRLVEDLVSRVAAALHMQLARLIIQHRSYGQGLTEDLGARAAAAVAVFRPTAGFLSRT